MNKNKYLTSVLSILMAVLMSMSLTACGSDDDVDHDNSNVNNDNGVSTEYEQNCYLFQQLIGTSWTLTSWYHNTQDYFEIHPETRNYSLTFTNSRNYTINKEGCTNQYILESPAFSNSSLWHISDDKLHISAGANYGTGWEFMATLSGGATFSFYGNSMTVLGGVNRLTFSKTSGSGNNNGGSGGGTSQYETPDIDFYDCTPSTTSLKVTYRIWNKEDCGSLSNAKIYYGTSSASKSISATISGQYITARISGLKKGTDYYVKCSVKGSAGMTTTDETRVSTLY